MGTIDRRPRRKYHGLLTVREPGVGEPLNVVAELEEWFDIQGQRFALHSYDWGNVIEPNGSQYLIDFDPEPRWTYRLADITVSREVWLEPDADAVWIRYAFQGLTDPVELRLRPLIRCRPFHDLTVANPFLNGQVDVHKAELLEWSMQPYKDVPPLFASLHGIDSAFDSDGHWYEGVHYEWEHQRGYDDTEDLFTPGEFRLTLETDGFLGVRLGTSSVQSSDHRAHGALHDVSRSFLDELDKAAEAYLVNLTDGRTGVIAGYPWFGEWSRDALVSLPGLCLARDRVEDALAILESLADRLENGLVPNLPKSGDVPANPNAIDASLLFIRATSLTAKCTRSRRVAALQRTCLDVIEAIFEGADPRVQIDADGFVFIERGDWALTWMDAVIGGEPVTPRWGYAVDLNALWGSALTACVPWAQKHRPELTKELEETAKKLSEHFEERVLASG